MVRWRLLKMALTLTPTGHTHLAALEAAEQHYQNALHLYARALAARERQIQSIAMFVSAPQMLACIDALSGDYYGFLSVIRQHFMHDQVALREAFEAALRHTLHVRCAIPCG